ncbi:CFI-box-CTERM domain-containing protein [Plebeiibacterium marinum]|uniref:Uncharacterized protein n=1 Tax=Plebeiibacterium marinum TaxID=2992111 RepID=A0AAE3SJN8_9BACT|nr:CFI-box-CTERM domain-containing protein [Plebeiobacterium marinum]MCW3805674.1 hypothetical protein [Plebeiobacterium marinum]
MKVIKQNPFRVLGLLGNSTERELQKQIGIIKRYAEIGKTKSFDYDLQIIGNLSRTSEEIQIAASSIEQAQKKLHYSLFWFIKNSPLDEVALNHLNQNTNKAIEIWNKTLKDEVTPKNYSAYLNLSTLYLALSTIGEQLSISELQQAILLKGQLINSESFLDLSKEVTGNGIGISSDDVNKAFVDEVISSLKPFLDKANGINTRELISLFSSYPVSVQKYLASKFTEVPISNIENSIDKATSKRKSNPRDAEEHGEELYKQTKADITLLNKLLGKDSVQYQMLVNKLANEILQCAVDFFIEYRDSDEYDPGEPALKVMKMAKSINPTGQTKSRIDENIENLQEWIDGSEERNIQKKIHDELVFIGSKLERFQKLSDTVSNAKDLVVSCKPKLDSIKATLGSTNEIYLKMSSAIVGNAQGMLVAAVNEAQEGFKRYKDFGGLGYSHSYSGDSELNKLLGNLKVVSLSELKTIVVGAYEVTTLMTSFDMDYQLRSKFNENRSALGNIKNQIQSATRSTTPSYSSGSSSSGSSGGCYIATMAYGSYDHPQVIILRKFRDEILSHSIFGKAFIRFYYATSPSLVKALQNQKKINHYIRNILDRLIKHIQ